MEEKPNYYAIIPANVRYDDNLKLGEKMMYGEITALANKTGVCYASNNYFARLYKVSPQAISKWIKSLEKFKYITITYEKEGKEIKKRAIEMITSDVDKVSTQVDRGINSSLEGYQQRIKENNTSINNTSIKEIYKEKFKKPTLEEIEEYCKQRNNEIDAKRFFDYYETDNWKDVKNWKKKLITWEMHQPKKKKTREEELEEMNKRLAYLDEE